MYDSINLAAIPADAECILIYTDGKYAETAAEVKARWPNATFQTISAVGLNPAEWIDVEPGCVWPPEAAVGVYRAWKESGQPIRGFYSSTTTQQALQEELAHVQIAVNSVEWFDADWNNVPHIDMGDSQTQFESTPGYDVSEVPDPPAPTPAPTPPPAPTPAPTVTGEDMPAPCVFNTTFDNNQQVFWVDANGQMNHQYWAEATNVWSPVQAVSTGWQPNAPVTVNSNSKNVVQVWAFRANGTPGQVYWNGSEWVTQT